jgi:hypothetical protein
MNFTTVSPISTDSVTVLRLSVREEWIFLTVPRQNEFGEMVEGQRHGIALGGTWLPLTLSTVTSNIGNTGFF